MKLNNFEKSVLIGLIIIIIAIIVFIVLLLIQYQVKNKETIKIIISLQADNWLLRLENKDNQIAICVYENLNLAERHQDIRRLNQLVSEMDSLRVDYKKFYKDNLFFMTDEKYYIWYD